MAGSDDAPSATEAARRAKLERLRGKRRSSKSKAGDQASSSSPPASAPTSPDDLGGFPSFDAAAPPAEASAPTMRGVAEAPPDFGSDAKALEDRWGTAAYLLRNPKLPDAAALARTALAARDRRGKGCGIPTFKGSYLGRFSLVSADLWTIDLLSERSRSVDVFPWSARARNARVEATSNNPFPRRVTARST